jgi:hypothetical protein
VESIARWHDGVAVSLRNGARHEHRRADKRWHVSIKAHGATSTIDLGAAVERRPADAARVPVTGSPVVIPRVRSGEEGAYSLTFELSQPNYRRSELTWEEAGKPTASVSLSAEPDELVVAVDVRKSDVHFASRSHDNPLDNEHPDTNSDGVQLHVIVPGSASSGRPPRDLNWLIVPEPESGRVRIAARVTGGDAPALRASSEREPHGYSVRIAVSLADLGLNISEPFKLGVVVNDMVSDRERRRGQLVLGGRSGEFVYLRGDRLAAEDLLDFLIASDS